MNLTDLQRTELYLSEIYFRVIKEFALHDLEPKFNFYNLENHIALLNHIDQLNLAKNNTKLRTLLDLLNDGMFLNFSVSTEGQTFSTSDMKKCLDEYLKIDPCYHKTINLELFRQPFSLKNMQHKKYISLKKNEIFLRLIKEIFIKNPQGWKSANNIVENTYTQYINKFTEFDISWINNEICTKEKYLIEIPNLFQKKVYKNQIYQKSECINDFEDDSKVIDSKINNKYSLYPDISKIKTEFTKTQNEITKLNEILESLKSWHCDQEILKQYLPYYGDGTERELRRLLSENTEILKLVTILNVDD
ncbi:MAG: hypothetical protein ACTIMQ_06025 [Acinetobacter guillouiae]